MCSITGVYDFPLKVTIPVTDTLNKTIEDLHDPLEIKWGPKATPPTFLYTGQLANLGFTDYGINTSSSLRLKGSSFSHLSTQLCQSLHRSFLPTNDARDCSGELIMTFKANSPISEGYVFVCIPLLARATSKPSAFLTALNNDALPGQPLGISAYLPQRGLDYITYVTCCSQVKEQKTLPVDIRVFVFIKGLECSPDLLNSIAAKTTKPRSSGSKISFSPVFLPDGILPQTKESPFTIATEQQYKSKLLYSTLKISPSGRSGNQRTDDLSSYKCVPLDPERNIKNNQIVVDTTNGEILTDVMKERKETIQEPIFTPARIEKIFFIGLAVLITLFILVILTYLVMYITTDNPNEIMGELIGPLREYSVTFLIGAGSVVLGLVLGIYIKSL